MMRPWLIFWILLGAPIGTLAKDNGQNSPWNESLTRLLSPELRRIDARIVEIDHELEPLPRLKEETWGSRFGHRSADLPTESQPDWIQFDLERERMIDMIVLAPVYLSYLNKFAKDGEGYGFPKRFKIEVADNPEMLGAVTVVDQSSEDVTNPGRFLLSWRINPVQARYVRFTSLKHVREENSYFWAMEEMMVFSKGINVGISMQQSISSSMDLFPQWSPARISDGQSTLGMPVDMSIASPTKGFLSADALDENENKWLSIDLGSEHIIEQICLLPLESDDYEVVGGRGFPRTFKVEFARDANFNDVTWEVTSGTLTLGYPAGCAYTLQVPDVKARHVRITPLKMWQRDSKFRYGLAEVQVYAEGENVALGKNVRASDQADKPKDSGWAPKYLVDGFTSRYRLIDWPDYLELIEQRRVLEQEREKLFTKRDNKLKFGRRLITASGVGVFIAVMAGWIWAVRHSRVLRRREMLQIRDQISRDLHDDIGSNLGGIVLLSETGSQLSTDPELKHDFESIRAAAEDASESMRDIVWLIQKSDVGLRDFVTHMRQSTQTILRGNQLNLVVEPATMPDRKVDLFFRRHVFLAFKESLNNVRKHAGAKRVDVHIEIMTSGMRFVVTDDGCGFDPESIGESSSGLGNLSMRASQLSGSVKIESATGQGTTVSFEIPFQTQTKRR